MKNKIIYFLLIVIVIEGLFFAFRPNLGSIRTDSGWDTNYDSGGSSDWGSDWGSNRSSGSYHSSSSSSLRGADFENMSYMEIILLELFFTFLIFICVAHALKGCEKKDKIPYYFVVFMRPTIMILLSVFINKNMESLVSLSIIGTIILLIWHPWRKRSIFANLKDEYEKELDENNKEKLIKMGITDVDKLKKDLYKIFVDVQIAWMEFDYDALAKLCGDELYNSYKRDLEILKLKNGKNIMKNFDEIRLDIESIYKRDNNIFINVILEVEFYDYVINTKTNKVIRGDKNRLYNNAYLLKYKKENALLDRCPSCGAQIKNLSNQKCPNCKNVIVNNNNDFVLISKGLVE